MLELPRTFRPAMWVSGPLAALVLVIAGCTGTLAQTEYDDVPVLVAAEDEDPTTVRRGSDIYKRTIAELKSPLRRQGFAVIDEESVAVDQRWEIRDRRPKTELIGIAKAMARSETASHRVRALVLFRIHAAHEVIGGRGQVYARLDGEIIDVVGNRDVDYFQLPRWEFNAPAKCDKLCLSEIVGDHASKMGGALGTTLSKQLASYRDQSVRDGGSRTGSGEAVTDGGRSDSAAGSGYGVITTYTVTLEDFGRIEALAIIGTMSDEFPGYKHHELMRQMPGFRRYAYTTSAKVHKMEEWLTILLHDMGFNVDREIEFVIRGTDITLHKIVPTHDRPRSQDEDRRFK